MPAAYSVAYSVLGQGRTTNAPGFTLYTVPAETSAVVSTIAVTNVTDLPANASVYLPADGGSASDANALLRNVSVSPKSTLTLTLGVTLEEDRSIRVQSDPIGALTFHAFGGIIS